MTDNRTTELREKLTERGIEYTANDHLGAYETSWDGFTAMQLTPGAKLMMVFTPEQAIAATLGNSRAERTCRMEQMPECMHDDIECSNCGVALWAFSMDIEGKGVFSKPNYCPNCGCKVVSE